MARVVIYAIYQFWAENSRPPSSADLHQLTGVGLLDMRQAFAELSNGMALSFPDERIQLTIVKAPPFSAVPTPVACWMNDEFHAYLGCPAEALTVSLLPMYAEHELTIRSSCACCFAPIEMMVKEGAVVSITSADVRVCISSSPWAWVSGSIDRVCDNFHFVLDCDHARELDLQLGRRCAVATLEQIRLFGADVARRRMRDPSWGPIHFRARPIIRHLARSGVDVSLWA
jgi:Alkylmercury lyase